MDQFSFSSLKQMSAESRSINSLLKSENKVLTQPQGVGTRLLPKQVCVEIAAVIVGRVL